MKFGVRTVEIGGSYGETYPVTESRLELLRDTVGDIAKIREKHPVQMPRTELGKVRKMAILAMVQFPDGACPPDSFFEGKDYPESLENDLYAFFLTNTPKR
jgi:hypothetical protein